MGNKRCAARRRPGLQTWAQCQTGQLAQRVSLQLSADRGGRRSARAAGI